MGLILQNEVTTYAHAKRVRGLAGVIVKLSRKAGERG